jgi:predicted methyltransferase
MLTENDFFHSISKQVERGDGLVLVLWCLMPLSTIFQLYCGGQFFTTIYAISAYHH